MSDSRKYLKARDLFWTGFITGLCRRKELCARKTKIKGRVPKTSDGENAEASQTNKKRGGPCHSSLLLFFNRGGGERFKQHSMKMGSGLRLASGRQRKNCSDGRWGMERGLELEKLLFSYRSM